MREALCEGGEIRSEGREKEDEMGRRQRKKRETWTETWGK